MKKISLKFWRWNINQTWNVSSSEIYPHSNDITSHWVSVVQIWNFQIWLLYRLIYHCRYLYFTNNYFLYHLDLAEWLIGITFSSVCPSVCVCLSGSHTLVVVTLYYWSFFRRYTCSSNTFFFPQMTMYVKFVTFHNFMNAVDIMSSIYCVLHWASRAITKVLWYMKISL